MKQKNHNLLKSLEASTGIEPVYTDLQSVFILRDYNSLNSNWYQDITRTGEERDTRPFGIANTFCLVGGVA